MIAPTSYGFKYKKSFDKIFDDLSKKYELQLVPFLLEGVANNLSLIQVMACIQMIKVQLLLVIL